jgi:hypothetical protein
MALFSSAGGGGGALDVGSIKATLGYDHDTRGLKAWDRKVDGARRSARKPIEQELKADYDGRGFDKYDRSVRSADKHSHVFARASTGVVSGLRLVSYGAGAAGLALGVGFVAGAKKSIEASSDLNESLNASNSIFEKNGKQIEKWSKGTADSFGLARTESLQGAASIGAMLKPMGFAVGEASNMSMKMVELAGDMASFNNQDPSEMLERIRSGLAGESEPLRQFGVDLRVTAVEQFALNKGLIEQGEKLEGGKLVMASYKKILSDTKDQQGDFGRTSEGMANAQRRLRANVIDLSASFGDALRPVMQGAIGDVNDFVLQMKEGKGAGGDFADFIRDMGHDVEKFGLKIQDVLSDKSLDPKEKAERIFGMFAGVAADAIEAAVPKIADAAAAAAPHVAERFVSAFIGADSWGRLALGAFLITKFGGLGALRSAGTKLGAGLGTGVAEGAALTVAGGGAAGGLGGKLKGALAAGGIVAKRIGIVGLGYAIGEEIIGGIQYEVEKGSDDVGTALGALASHGKGLYGLTQRTLDSLFGENAESDQAKAVLSIYESLAKTRGNISVGARKDVERQARELDLTAAQRKEVERMFRLLKQGQSLGKGRTSVGVDLGMDPAKLQEIRDDLNRLKGGVFATTGDIEKASKRLHKTIVEQFGAGTKEARELTARNLRATAEAFSQNMAESGNVTDAGLKRIKRLFRNADLMEGLHPEAIGRGFANAFGKAGDATKKTIGHMIDEFGKLPKGARQSAYEAMNDQLRELRKGGKLNSDQVKRIRSSMLAEFGGLKTDSVASTFDMTKGVLANFGALGNGIGAALQIIRDNTNAGLSTFNVSPVKWIVKTISSLVGNGAQKKARGGFLEGPSRGDVVPVLAGKDEAFVTSWQQQPINAALSFASAHGVVPYPHLGALFNDEKRPHAAGPGVQRRASGGYAYPGVEVINNPKKDNEVGTVNKALAVMERIASMHVPYVWGGGHGGFDSSPTGLDCSGAVSLVLHEAGLLASPLVSGALESWGEPGPGAITVYANPQHAWMEANGRPWGTSVNDSSHGLGFYGDPGAGYKGTFVARHAAGAVMTELARVMIGGPDGPIKEFGQAAVDKVWKGANAYLKSKMPDTAGGGDANVMGGFKGGKIVGASTYHPDAYTGTVGAAGKSLVGTMSFAELGMGHNLGGLPFGAKLKIGYGGKSVVGEKLDIGLGGGSVDGHRRDIDLWYETANALGLPNDWLGLVQIGAASRGGFVGMQEGGHPDKPANIPKAIDGLFDKLAKTKGKGKRDEVLDKIRELQKRLTARRSKKRKATYRGITAKGGMDGYAAAIKGGQENVTHAEEQVGGLEEVHNLTEPRDVDVIMEGLGIDPESDLSKLTEDQKAAIKGAIDSDYGLEERELKSEIEANNRELKAMLTLRKVILHGIEEGKRRIARAEKRRKTAEEEQDRIQKLAREVEKELETLRDELQDLERGKPPKQAKGESDKDHKAKVDAWQNNRDASKRRLGEAIERHQSRHQDLMERARNWGSIAAAEKSNVSNLGSWVTDEAESALTEVQGTDRSRDPDVNLAPLRPGGGAPQFGGQILDQQAKLAELGSTKFVRPDPLRGVTGDEEEEPATELDYANAALARAELTPGDEDDNAAKKWILEIAERDYQTALGTPDPRDDIEAAQALKAAQEAVAAGGPEQQAREAEAERLKEERTTILEEENARFHRNELVMRQQAPSFSAATGFPQMLASGGFADFSKMLLPFVGSYRVGTQFVPRDGLAMVHRGEEIKSRERVAESRGGDVNIAMLGDLAWLAPYVRAHIVDELDSRGEQAAAASRRPAAGVIARRVGA